MIETSPAAASPTSRSRRGPELRVPMVEVNGLRKTYRTARGELDLF